MNYWKEFYLHQSIEVEPSKFCTFIINYFNKNLNILDCGCGNGRDSYAFASNYTVTGIDLGTIPKNAKNCTFLMDNFCTFDKSSFDIIYSRFTFHSITNEDHEIFLDSIKPNSFLCIETRSDKGINDARYHGDNHYRNFTNKEYLNELLLKYKFKIIFFEESDNVAIYKTENPICIRVIAKRL
jgi:tellurite methyltransferase